MKDFKKYTDDVTYGVIQKASTYIYQKYNPYEDSLEKLAKAFLNIFILDDCFKKEFNEIRELFIVRFYEDEDKDHIPNDENDFYKFICKTYLNIVENKLTNEMLLNKIKNDLKEIDIIKGYLSNERININSKNKLGKGYKLNKLDELYKKIKWEEEKIIDFFINKMESKSSTRNRITSLPDSDELALMFLYSYNINKNSYMIDYFSDLKHKLMKYPVVKVNKLIEIRNKDKSKFLSELDMLVDYNEVIASIESKVIKSHVLRSEKILLFDILDLFKNDKHLLFSFIAPIQIESLINKYCIELGVDEFKLNSKSVNQKVELIKKHDGWKYSAAAYTYFSYDFPILRNNVAHGYNLNENESELYSKLFLLDLNFIVDKFISTDLPMNKKLYSIRQAIKTNELLYLIKASAVYENEIDQFYSTEISSLGDIKKELHKKLSLSDFKKCTLNPFEYDYVKECIIKIKEQGIKEETCVEILKYLNE